MIYYRLNLQSDFNTLQHWLATNELQLNTTKSHTMIFGIYQSIKSKTNVYSCVITCPYGTPLLKVEHTKYLGLWLDSELNLNSILTIYNEEN